MSGKQISESEMLTISKIVSLYPKDEGKEGERKKKSKQRSFEEEELNKYKNAK